MSRKNGPTAAEKRRRPKQLNIPGTEPPSVPEIEEAADEYRSRRDRRMAAGEDETEAADRLLALMKEHGLQVYTFDGYTVTMKRLDKVQVRRTGNGEED